MGVLTNAVERSEIKPGDHIYTYRAAFTYTHHGIFVGDNKVVHFSPDTNSNSSTWICSDSSLCNKSGVICSSYPECGFRQPNSGVLRSCLDCFLGSGSLYRFEYGVTRTFFLAQVRGGTCSIAKSDPPEQVIHRALYLLQYGFGNYDVLSNNCEDFALYCKTGLQVVGGKEKAGGQATSFLGAPLAAFVSSPLKWLVPNPVGIATVTAGSVLMYCTMRYANDFGVRKDVINVAVENLVENMGWEANEAYFLQKNSAVLPILDGTNISEWSDQVQFYLGVWDLDLALRTEKPPAITYSSSTEENAIYKSWERSNRLSIMFMQMSIVDNIKSTLPECDSAKEFFNNVEERFRSVDKSLTGTMVTELTTMKFDGTHGMHEHIIEMTNLTTRLKALGMNVDELLLVQFIFNSLPPEYELIQIQYNTHMDKWNVHELSSILVQEEAKLKQQGHHSVHLVSQGATKIEVPEVNGTPQVIEVHEKRQNNVIEPLEVNGHEKRQNKVIEPPEVNGHEKRQNKVIEPPKVNGPVHKKRQHMNVQCYFCEKFGHIQKNCKKRRAWFEKKGIFVGGNKVVHFSPERNSNSNSNSNSSTWLCSDSSLCNKSGVICSSYPECGFKQPNSGVLRSCLDCFLGNGSLYRFKYGVTRTFFLAQVRGGTCSIAKSDPPEQVIHRALYLVQYGFGNYDVLSNNCENFALYCKTGLQVAGGKKKPGGQAASFLGFKRVAIDSSRLMLLFPNPVGVATVTAGSVGMYCIFRYENDFGVRKDVIKVAVEDLVENMGWEANEAYFVQNNPAFVPILDGRNFLVWSEQVKSCLDVWDLDLALRTDKPPAITNSSSAEEKAKYKSWERSNRLSIMFMQMSIVNNIKSTLPKCDSAKEFFKNVEERFRSVDKSLTGTLVAELTTMKFDGTRGMHEHIIEMTNLTTKLKALGMNVDEFLLVQFIFNSLPPQYELIQIQYKTHKDKWNVNELTSILVQEEARLKQQEYHSAHLVSPGAKKIELLEVNGPLQVIEVLEKRENNVIEPSEVNGPPQVTEDHEKRQNNVTKPPKVNVRLQVSEVHAKRNNNVKCYFCKKFGHVQKYCYKRRARFENKGRP